MTDFANLVLGVDARSVKDGVDELDKLVASGGAAEQASNELSSAWTKADVAITALGKGTAEAKAAIAAYKAALKDGTITQEQYEAEILRTRATLSGLQQDHRNALNEYNKARAGLDGVTASAGQQRAGMQQLSYQIGDVAQQFALGTNPMIIFAQQGQQVVQALSLMRGGATGLVGFLAGPWGGVIMGAATVAGMFASKLLESGDAAQSAAKDYDDAAAAAKRLAGAQNALRLNEAQMKLNDAQSRRLSLENQLALGSTSLNDRYNRGSIGESFRNDRLRKELQAVNWEIVENANVVKLAERANRELDASFNKVSRSSGGAAGGARSHASAARAATKDVSDYTKALAAMSDAYTDAANAAYQAFKGTTLFGDGLRDQIKAANDNMEASWNRSAEEVKAGLDAQAEATAKWNDELRGVIQSLDEIGGFGKTLGDIGAIVYGLRTGDYSGVRGPVGYLLKQVGDITVGRNEDGSLRRVGDVFSDALDKVFGKDGSFMKALQGAGTGVAIGSLLFGQDNKGAQVGGAIGGGIGMAIGGPIGSIVGSILGSVFGGIFKKTKYGTASIVNGQITTGGNNKELTSNAGTAASGLNSVLEDIATRLGGSLGNYSVSIGQMDGKWRVSTTGRTGKLETKYKDVTDFGKEGAQQAMMAAIADAIRDGAIAGIRASTQNLLKSGSDVEKQLAKALKFQGVFDDLKAATDPAGFALEQITRQFDDLRKIFAEAGASAEEYAQLEELLAIKRKEAANDARAAIVDKVRDPLEMQITILQLLGKQEEALAASRLMELAGLEDTLQPLQSMIYQLQDARAIIDTFGPLADDLRKYREELLGGTSGDSFGQIAAKFRATALAAANGDAEALAGLRGVSGSYLDAARANAGSSLEYRRALADVLTSVDKGIFAADAKVDYAQLQIDATVNVANLLADMKTELATLQGQVVDNTAQTLRLWQRFEGDGLTVKTTADEPLQVEIAA